MSAFKKKSDAARSQTTYIKVVNGDMVYNSTKEDPDAKERYSEKADKTFYEVPVAYLEGFITNSKYVSKELEGGKKIENVEIQIDNNGETVTIQVPFEASHTATLIKRLPNVEIDKTVKIAYYKIENKETKKFNEGFTIEQDGKKIPFAFTRENKNGLPDAIQSGRGNNIKWNFQPVHDFLYGVFEEFCTKVKEYNENHVLGDNLDDATDTAQETKQEPKKESSKAPANKQAVTKKAKVEAQTTEDDEDDTPF